MSREIKEYITIPSDLKKYFFTNSLIAFLENIKINELTRLSKLIDGANIFENILDNEGIFYKYEVIDCKDAEEKYQSFCTQRTMKNSIEIENDKFDSEKHVYEITPTGGSSFFRKGYSFKNKNFYINDIKKAEYLYSSYPCDTKHIFFNLAILNEIDFYNRKELRENAWTGNYEKNHYAVNYLNKEHLSIKTRYFLEEIRYYASLNINSSKKDYNQKKLTANKCKVCDIWLSKYNNTEYCSKHGNPDMIFDKYKKKIEPRPNLGEIDGDFSDYINIFISIFNRMKKNNAELWNLIKLIVLLLKPHISKSGKTVDTLIANSLNEMTDYSIEELREEVTSIFLLINNIYIFIESYFYHEHIKTIESNPFMFKVIENPTDYLIKNREDVINLFWKNEVIKNSCSYEKSIPCKSKIGKVKYLFKNMHTASLYLRENQEMYFCPMNGLGIHIRTKIN